MDKSATELALSWMNVHPAEKSRTYIFPGNSRVTFANVNKVSARPGHSHRLETVDGKKYIIKDGWLAIEIDTPSWSF